VYVKEAAIRGITKDLCHDEKEHDQRTPAIERWRKTYGQQASDASVR